MQANFMLQLKKGVLEMLVLKMLEKEDEYGYQLMSSLREKTNVFSNLREGTLYPVLYRLEKIGLVESYLDCACGSKKKFYSITEEGRQHLIASYEYWVNMEEAVALVMNNRKCQRS